MYNVYFGDCFCISESDNNLVVDFGIHQNSAIGLAKDDIYRLISDDLAVKTNKELVITHFHEDHISGLMYMKSNSTVYPHPFVRMYIPDIFSDSKYAGTVSLLILKDMMRNTKLSENSCSLLAFVEYLCSSVGDVALVTRGDKIQKYTVLWPTSESIIEKTVWLVNNLLLDHSPLYEALNRESIKLINIVQERVSQSDSDPAFTWQQRLVQITEILEYLIDEYASYLRYDRTRKLQNLNSFGNFISIVFHNTDDGKENTLFTGDVLRKSMKQVMNNSLLPSIPLHTKYKYIKASHHGTQRYHVDFSPLDPDFIMIPNGRVNARWFQGYRIDSRYSIDFAKMIAKPQVYCSNCDNCNSNIHAGGLLAPNPAACVCAPNRRIVGTLLKEIL